MELHVLLRNSAVPTVEEWQRALTEASFNLILDNALKIREASGYSPAIYNGVKTGFEFDLFPASDIMETYEGIAEQIGDRDLSANFRWGGDLRECVAACIASGVLTKLCDGILYDPQENIFFGGDEAIAMARQTIQDAGDLDS
jgi:hypothetical protein